LSPSPCIVSTFLQKKGVKSVEVTVHEGVGQSACVKFGPLHALSFPERSSLYGAHTIGVGVGDLGPDRGQDEDAALLPVADTLKRGRGRPRKVVGDRNEDTALVAAKAGNMGESKETEQALEQTQVSCCALKNRNSFSPVTLYV
jgi:hypothetical protein